MFFQEGTHLKNGRELMGGKILGLNPCDEVMFRLTIYKI
jgi:hypothetical protein